VGVDTASLRVGDVVRLRITGRNNDNEYVAADGVSWSTNAPANIATVTSDGILSAISATGGQTYTITGRYNNQNYTAPLRIRADGAFVVGRVRNSLGNGVPDTRVLFYNAAGNQVGSAYASPEGSFRAAVGTDAVRFAIDLEVADPVPGGRPNATAYHRQFGYGDNEYLGNEPTCRAPLPALTEGATVSLTADVVPTLRTSSPPPPPSGCLD